MKPRRRYKARMWPGPAPRPLRWSEFKEAMGWLWISMAHRKELEHLYPSKVDAENRTITVEEKPCPGYE